jgi:septum site-determining protein MinD
MTQVKNRIFKITFLFLFFVAQNSFASPSRNLTIFTEPNLSLALTKISRLYSQKFNVIVSINFNSSADLINEIDFGEPADVFISSHEDWIEILKQKGLVDVYNVSNIAKDKLVLATSIKNDKISLDEARKMGSINKILKFISYKKMPIIIDSEYTSLGRYRSKIIKEVLEEALGLGPLEDLLAEQAVSEIMVNGYKKIFVERGGKITLSTVTFTSNMHLRNVIERIVTPLGRRIDEKTPYVDARLKDGSRVNAVIEPLAIDGPAVTIRKFKKGGIAPEKYVEWGSLTKGMLDFLKICVENGMNVVISGGTGSGKTSLLNMLSGYIPAHDRVVTIEDAAELQLGQEHVVRLESRPANMEGTGAVTIRDLVKNALRMRPDRIVVGECRDGAALDMLQAMNTGHDGSMTTTHANTPKECIGRLETLCMMAGMGLPVEAIKSQIASAVNLIIQQSRLSDGSRKITSITEVQGMQGEVVTLAEIFKFKETGYDINRKIKGQFQFTGTVPKMAETFPLARA